MTIGIVTCFVFSGHSANASETLVIVGTGSGISILKSIGSGGGIRAVGNDEYTLGRTARNIDERETSYGLKELPFAKMPIAFFVNNGVSLDNISPETAGKIYAGTIRKWENIGGGTGTIRVIRREAGDS